MKNHWKELVRRWHLLEPPLRPHPDVVEAMVAIVGQKDSNVLLLGVTPELVERFDHLTAVDRSADMIGALWRPTGPDQKVRASSWLSMDESFGPYSAVIGDASFNALQSEEEVVSLGKVVKKLIAEDGTFACRIFERPVEPVTDNDIEQAIADGHGSNFNALKWKIAMSIAEASGMRVKVVDILDKFNRLFPDREAVALASGWATEAIDTIDAYQGSDMALCFPNRLELEECLGQDFELQWQACGSYPLAECCPLMVARPHKS